MQDRNDAMISENLQSANFQQMINFFDFIDLDVEYLFQPVNPVNLSDKMIPVDLKSKSWLVM